MKVHVVKEYIRNALNLKQNTHTTKSIIHKYTATTSKTSRDKTNGNKTNGKQINLFRSGTWMVCVCGSVCSCCKHFAIALCKMQNKHTHRTHTGPQHRIMFLIVNGSNIKIIKLCPQQMTSQMGRQEMGHGQGISSIANKR